jgi:hypothetical protein
MVVCQFCKYFADFPEHDDRIAVKYATAEDIFRIYRELWGETIPPTC